MTILLRSGVVASVAFISFVLSALGASAQVGQPAPGQIHLQESVTPVMTEIATFYDAVTWVIIAITVFVLILMLIVMFRFNERANPTPSKTTHNTLIEFVWTAVPVLILIGIGIYSFKLLYLQYSYPKPDLTIKATANAWFWEHSYPDQGGFTVTSNMLTDEDLLREKLGDDEFDKKYDNLPEESVERSTALYAAAKPLWAERGLVRQLSVDNEIAVPVGAVVHMLITSRDVIHSWTIPSFGSKMQAVPGRITATWFKAEKTGIYYGQCSVLCGAKHSAMPIAVRVVEKDVFDRWTAAVKDRKLDEARKILSAAAKGVTVKKLAAISAAE